MKKLLRPDEIEKFKKTQEEYRKLAHRSYDRLNPEQYKKEMKKKREVNIYNKNLITLMNEFLTDKEDILKSLAHFVNNQVDEQRGSKINVKAFNKGYRAIKGNYQISTNDLKDVFEKKILDCEKDPIVCNYKYFMKTFYSLLTPKNKMTVLEEMKKYLKSNVQSRSVKDFVLGQKNIKEWPLSKAEKEFKDKNILNNISKMPLEELMGMYKFLVNRPQLKVLKSNNKDLKTLVSKIKDRCYCRLHYHVNKEHLKEQHALGVVEDWYKKNTFDKTKKKDIDNTTRNKKEKQKYLKKYYNKQKVSEEYRKKRRLLARMYYMLNKDKQREANKRYMERKKLKKSVDKKQ